MKKNIPPTRGLSNNISKIPHTPKINENYKDCNPTWSIRLLEEHGDWGYIPLSNMVKFNYGKDLLEYVSDNNLNTLHDTLDECQRKTKPYSSYHNLLKNLQQEENISIECLLLIFKNIQRDFFAADIIPKLKEFEKLTWHEIENQKYGNEQKTKHHNIEVERLCPAAQKRLRDLKMDDVGELFSFRLEGKLRIFGRRIHNCFQIMWIDTEHQICPMSK